MTVPLIDFQKSSYEYLKAEYDKAHEATQAAWFAEIKAAKALQESNTWKQFAPSWKDYCVQYMPHKAPTYRAYLAEVPIAEIVESAANTALGKSQARQLRERIADVVADEDKAMIPSIWQLCYEAEKEIIPRRDVIQAAYQVLKDERDNHSISVYGESVDLKALAQSKAVKEALLTNIIHHTEETKQKVTIEANNGVLEMLKSILPKGAPLPAMGSLITMLWKKG